MTGTVLCRMVQVTNLNGATAGKYRVMRGGSFFGDVLKARSSFRNNFMPADRYSFIGFRLARTP